MQGGMVALYLFLQIAISPDRTYDRESLRVLILDFNFLRQGKILDRVASVVVRVVLLLFPRGGDRDESSLIE